MISRAILLPARSTRITTSEGAEEDVSGEPNAPKATVGIAPLGVVGTEATPTATNAFTGTMPKAMASATNIPATLNITEVTDSDPLAATPTASATVAPAVSGAAGFGMDRTRTYEATPEQAKRFHHPSATSGVTIGNGCDLKARSSDDIRKILSEAGCPETFITVATGAHGLTGADADKFVEDHQAFVLDAGVTEKLFELTYAERCAVLDRNLPKFESEAAKKTFEANKGVFYDLAYQVGIHKWPGVMNAVAKGDMKGAAGCMLESLAALQTTPRFIDRAVALGLSESDARAHLTQFASDTDKFRITSEGIPQVYASGSWKQMDAELEKGYRRATCNTRTLPSTQ